MKARKAHKARKNMRPRKVRKKMMACTKQRHKGTTNLSKKKK